MPKIGIVAQYLDSRNDIRQLIEKLATGNEIILYVRKNDLKTTIPGVTVREITARRKTLKNELLSRLFYLFGIIPRSRQNYFIVEQFKIVNTKTYPIFKLEKKLLLFLSRFLPRFISYDQYLDWLDYTPTTKVDDIETFFCFTEIYDDYFLKHLISAQKKIFVYVYSWDHPCKMVRFSKRVHRYLVWNEGLKEDMIDLQGMDASQVEVLGSSQLAYIAEFKKHESKYARPFPFEYIYFGCATGTPQLVRQEVAIIEQLAVVLEDQFPNLKLIVRPYPFLGAWDLYTSLRGRGNVYFDDDFRDTGATFALSTDRVFEKFAKIKFAEAFIHIGTTMGFEATYFNTPVLQINFPTDDNGPLSIHGFIHQYQNDKYLMLTGYPNVLRNTQEFAQNLSALLRNKHLLLEYNYQIAQQTPLRSFDELADRLGQVLHSKKFAQKVFE